MFWNTPETIAFVCYYILAFFSIVGNLWIVIYLLRRNRRVSSPFTFIVLCLHFSLTVEEVASLPYLFNTYDTVCVGVEYIHSYAVLMNIVSITLLVQAYRGSKFEDKLNFQAVLQHYGIYLILCFPMICFLQFLDTTNQAYTHTASPWCSFRTTDTTNLFSPLYFYTYHFWIWTALIISSFRILRAMYRLLIRTNDWTIIQRYVCSIGVYVWGMLLAWLPHTILLLLHTTSTSTAQHIEDDSVDSTLIEWIGYVANAPVYVIGIVYIFLFWRDRNVMEALDTYCGHFAPAQTLYSPLIGKSPSKATQTRAQPGHAFSSPSSPQRSSSVSTTRPSVLYALFFSRHVVTNPISNPTTTQQRQSLMDPRDTNGFLTIPEEREVTIPQQQQHQYSYSTTSSSLKRLTTGSGLTNASSSTMMFDSDLLRMIDTIATKPEEV